MFISVHFTNVEFEKISLIFDYSILYWLVLQYTWSHWSIQIDSLIVVCELSLSFLDDVFKIFFSSENYLYHKNLSFISYNTHSREYCSFEFFIRYSISCNKFFFSLLFMKFDRSGISLFTSKIHFLFTSDQRIVSLYLQFLIGN